MHEILLGEERPAQAPAADIPSLVRLSGSSATGTDSSVFGTVAVLAVTVSILFPYCSQWKQVSPDEYVNTLFE